MKLCHQIDHIVVETTNPEELFKLFHLKMGLPQAWPVSIYPTAPDSVFISGGVFFGNVNIEFLKESGSPTAGGPDHLFGIALEPAQSLDQIKTFLTEIDISATNGGKTELFENLNINDLLESPGHLFFCKYHFDIPEWRRSLATKLKSVHGGALDVKCVREIQIEATPEKMTKLSEIFTPEQNHNGLWRIGDGPALRLTEGPRTLLKTLVVEVGSLQTAKDLLQENGVLESESGRTLNIRMPSGFSFEIKES